jgi:hypothetical protein
MNIGDTVTVSLGSNTQAEGQVIDINGDILRIAGYEEIRRAAFQGRNPIGLTFKREKVKAKERKIVSKTIDNT